MICRAFDARTLHASGRFVCIIMMFGACSLAGPGGASDRSVTIRPSDPVVEIGPISPLREAEAAQLYARAEDALSERRFSEAAELSQQVVDDYPSAPVSGQALILYVRAATEFGLSAQADSAAERYIGLLPPGDQRAGEVRLLQAEALIGDPASRLDRLLRIEASARRNDLLRAVPIAREAVVELNIGQLAGILAVVPRDAPIAPTAQARYAALLLQEGDDAIARIMARTALDGGADGPDAYVAEAVFRGELPPDLLLVTSIRVAAVLPLGGSPQLAGFAESIAEGIEVAAVTVLGDRFEVEVVTLDDEGDPIRAAELMEELEADGVAGVVGLLQDGSLEAAGQARQFGLPLISPTARSASRAGEGVYSLEGPDPEAARMLARYSATQGHMRVAIIHSSAEEAFEEVDAYQEVAESFGIRIAGRFAYAAGATNFEEQILAARDALRRAEIAALGLGEEDTLRVELLEPVALFVPVPPEDVEFLAPQITHHALDTLGIDILGTGGWTDPTTLGIVEDLHTTGVVATARLGTGVLSPGYVRFQRAYEEHFQRSLVSSVPALGYDATLLLLEALRAGRTTPAAVQASFEGLREINGATGIFSAIGDRLMRRTHVVRIERGSLVPIG